MKKTALPVLIIVGLILVIVGYFGISSVIKMNTPSDERTDLSEYYNMTDESKALLIIDHKIQENHGTMIDGHLYLDYDFVYSVFNNRFFWDSDEKILLYVTATNVISAQDGESNYTVDEETLDFGRTIVQTTEDSVLISLDFVAQYTDIAYNFYTGPNRVMITKTWGEQTVIHAKADTQLRTGESRIACCQNQTFHLSQSPSIKL